MAQAVLHLDAVAMRNRARSRAFTLVELSAVVVIVSILAVVAVVGYKRLITASHSSEATGMINAIRIAQEAYKAETGTYADVSGGAGANISVTTANGQGCTNSSFLYPTTAPGNFKVGWGAACGSACPNAGISWSSIPLHVDGPVMYGYTTAAGSAGTGPAAISTMIGKASTYSVTFPTAPPSDWFLAAACGDPDGDGIFSAYLGSSFTNQIFESNDGN